MNGIKKSVGEKTRALILEKGLEMFREAGFEAATIRDIAKSANVATGATYYYFPSKEAIVAAYYDHVQVTHEAKVRELILGTTDLRERLGIVIHSKLDILKDDRKFLGALFRYAGEPDHPLSVFGKGTKSQRAHSVGIFREALADVKVSDELRQLLPWALWMMHLGAILFFIYDESAEQRRTRALVNGVLDLVTQFLKLTSAPVIRTFLQPFQGKMLGILKEAGWLLES
ncbi:MAG: TetR/AcrR family transcriptional regulator [Candidatus Acidiferrum sp.]